MEKQPPFTLEEIGSTYAHASERFVVAFVVTWEGEVYGDGSGVLTPHQAAQATLRLTQYAYDENAGDTQWWVFDRETKEHWCLEQREFEEGDGEDEDFLEKLELEEMAKEQENR